MRNVYLAMSAVMSVMLIGFAVWVRNLIAQLMRSREGLLRQLSETDALTGLHNREKRIDLLNMATTREGAAGTTALMFVDLDGFKQLNDTHAPRTSSRGSVAGQSGANDCTRSSVRAGWLAAWREMSSSC
ncbi:hypothetical protein WT83_10740 [Burkholderia territorii]|uniref:diguanylate cyclase n=1 Tax=Burkholderia territorii TaxID=1503055 RepID=A0A108EXC6_9BURK|nr:GGDEF domain-containing protein [Burkholderia territorii]KWN19208.1 hypothetical protein WT83_10740 [Burkholderia territorii]